MKEGDLIVCIEDSGFWYDPHPTEGEICKILNSKWFEGRLWLLIDGYDYELPGESADGIGRRCGFNSDCFRPLTFGEETASRIEKELTEIKKEVIV